MTRRKTGIRRTRTFGTVRMGTEMETNGTRKGVITTRKGTRVEENTQTDAIG
jgi:hypothetical protein